MRARRGAALACFALAALATPSVGHAQPAIIEAMTVRLEVRRDATLVVDESIEFAYQNLASRAYRNIPLRAPDGGLVRVRELEASDGAERAALAVDVTEREDVLEARPRGAMRLSDQGDLHLRLRYTLYRALRKGADGDRLDWVVVPNEWNGVIKSLRVEVHLPPSLPVDARVRASLARADGTPVRADILRGHRIVRLDAAGPAWRGDIVRLHVVWPPDHVDFTVPEPAAPWPAWMRWHRAWLVPVGLVLLTVLAWWVGRRAGRRPVVPIYTPPAGLRPGEAGVIIDGNVDTRDIRAAVVDLAGRGFLSLAPPTVGDVLVSVERPWIDDPDVRPWEVTLLVRVFSAPGMATAPLEALTAPGDSSIRDALSADLAQRGFFASPPVALRRAGCWIAVITTAIWLQVAWNEGAHVSTILAGIATGALLWIIAGVVTASTLTAQGRAARQRLLGFREFLARVDAPRLERLAPARSTTTWPGRSRSA